ncbi:MAG: pilus assembly protein [Paracoccaceae bacterium]|jgi:hypothetical protein|nr:pilus assembly protein [Paracoccaceae bacterium]MDP7185843.1 pilus assembly protein [Paracoccaceae bacterium]
MRIISFTANKLKTWLRRENGSVTLEFIILFPAILILFLASLEISFYMSRISMLERALDQNIRLLRLGGLQPATHEQLVFQICGDAMFSTSCPDDVLIELTPISTDTWNMPERNVTCVNRDEDIEPVINFQPGRENEIMLVRACAIVDPIFASTAFTLGMPKAAENGFLITAASTFVNEP